MEQGGRNGPVEICWDGRTVWVNDQSGCCIGRFSALGVDVHRTGEQQIATGQQCPMVARRSPRDDRSKTPPGPEGSNGIDRLGCRGQADGLPPFFPDCWTRIRPPGRG